MAFATPFESEQGRTIVASSRSGLVGLKSLSQADPQLGRAVARASAGRTGGGYQYSSRAVAGAPWPLVIAVPSAKLFEPIAGSRRYLPWLLWAAAVLGGLACSLLVANLLSSRVKLRDANRSLDRLARIDALTGLHNRRQAQDSLDAAGADAHRYEQPLSVLMIDVDHFKQTSDNYGHETGDEVLRLIADVVCTTLRAGDVLGRWGGEEFLAILPSTGRSGAARVAERVREAVSSTRSSLAASSSRSASASAWRRTAASRVMRLSRLPTGPCTRRGRAGATASEPTTDTTRGSAALA